MGLVIFAQNKFWASSQLENITLDMNKYNNYLDQLEADDTATESIVIQANYDAMSVPEDCNNFIKQCNEIIVKFFLDNYAIDVTEKLNQLQPHYVSYPDEVSDFVGGSYYSDIPEFSSKIFFNKNIIDNFIADVSNGEDMSIYNDSVLSFRLMRTIYIHETMHYLGFSSENVFDYFTEAMAESLNEKVQAYSGINYENITGYAGIKDTASQIIDVDKEIVTNVLTNGADFNLTGYFNEQMDGDYAKVFENLIMLQQKGADKTHSDISYFIQFIIYEYMKATQNYIEKPKSLTKSIEPNFELKWLLFHSYRYN